MIDNFLIINCIGKDDKLGLRINKDFFIHTIDKKKEINKHLVSEIFDFLNRHKVKPNENLSGLFDTLKDINSKLWVIEDDKRLCEKNSDFGEKFIKLSRDIHFLNDKRASIKLEINNQTGSKIKEIKEYTSY